MKNQPSPVPSLHYVMIVATLAVILLSMVFYLIAPAAKMDFFAGMALTFGGFLTGKLSNQFGKPWRPARRMYAEPDEDDEPLEVDPVEHRRRLVVVGQYQHVSTADPDDKPQQAIVSAASPTKEDPNAPAPPTV